MKKGWIVVAALFIIIIIGVAVLIFVPGINIAKAPPASNVSGDAANTNMLSDMIVVTSPTANGTVGSPLTIVGMARGSWYFEASAPVALLDQNGSVIAQGTIQAQADWMTSEFVPFRGSLTFDPQPAGSVGTLVLTNDNPSGDPTKQFTLDVPVKF